jgi:SpoIID/LytB domain protein
MSRRPLALSLAAVLVAAGLSAAVAATSDTAAAVAARSAEPVVGVPAGGALRLTGHGYGHGRGMSQYGAEGAARAGLSAAQILDFYYPGTTSAQAAGKMGVLIGADTSADTVVLAAPRLVARVVGSPSQRWSLSELRRDAVRWRLKPVAGARTALAYRTAGGRWTRIKVLGGTVEFFAGGAPVTLVLPGGSAAYRGALRNAPVAGQGRATVNVVGLQNYLRGVVAREMPSSWSPAALQAQAVAARTYAAYERSHTPRGRAYQTCDSTACQVYGGVAAETRATDAAVTATNGQIRTFAGQPAFTQFSSSSGGWTVRGTAAYQAAKADPYDAWPGNRMHDWTATVSAARLQAAWPSIGTPTGVQVLARDGNGEWGGRVLTLRLTGSKRSVTLDATDFRTALGLRSTWFTFS